MSRRAHHVARHLAPRTRRTGSLVLAAALLVAGTGVAVAALRSSDEPDARAGSPSASASPASSPSSDVSPSGDAEPDPSASASTSPSTPTASPTPTPSVPHVLRVVTHPSGARLTIRAGEEVRRARTPFRGSLPGGDLELKIGLAGHNTVTEAVDLRRDRRVELWLDPKGLLHHKLGEFETGSLPKQVSFSPDGTELWVTALGESGIEVYDVATLERIDEIDSGEFGTVEVIFTPDGETVFVSQMQTASVFEIDRETRRVRRVLETGSSWSKVMALSPDGLSLYVANWVGDDVTEFDLTTGEVVRQIPTVDTPRGLFVTEDGERLFVAGYGNGDIQRIDLSTGKSRVLLTTGGAMRHMVGDAERGVVYANDMATDEVFVVNLRTEKVRKLGNTDEKPNSVDLTPDGRVLYVSNRGENNPISYGLPGPEWGSVLAIDARTGRVLDAIVGGNQCTGLDVSPDGRLLAYSDFLDNRVSVFEIPRTPVLVNGDGGRAEEHLEDIVKP